MENSFFLTLFIATFINDGNAQDHGHPAMEERFKHVASIWYVGERSCNGALITDSCILTAGHCVHRRASIDFRVIVGVVIATSSIIWRRVRSIHLHSGYDPVYRPSGSLIRANNDIAIMKLLNPLVFSNTIQSIPLSIELSSSCDLRCKLAGFRNTDSPTIKKVDFSLLTDNVVVTTAEDCAKLCPGIYRHYRCIFNPFDTRSPRPGDSGAPIVCNNVLTAILTGGVPQMAYAAKVIMVAPYVNWMQQVICNE